MLSWFYSLYIFSVFLLFYYLYFKVVASKYWKRRNVFQVNPVFLLGNNWKWIFFENVGFALEKRYREWKEKKLVGYWSFTSPSLLITDLELIRRILVRDFNHFTDRNININEEIDPLAGHLVNLKGSKWRNLRVKLTPTFTSGKMKMMFPTMVKCGLDMRKFLEKLADKEEVVEMREILARFTTDIISSCAFGIETNCINNPDSEFRNYGKKIFQPGFYFLVRFLFTNFFPRIRGILGIRNIAKDVSDFFIKIVKETMQYREQNAVKRNDFMDLLIQLKNKGTVEDVDVDHGNPESKSEKRFTLNQAAAQAFVFFAAGFETSSTTLSFAFYELAINPDLQEILQKEIDFILKKNDGRITYEGILEMEYLDWIVQETLRKYPPLPFLGRMCTKDYQIPEMNVSLEKGTRVVISILGIHRDPEFYPQPDKFEPTRFSPEKRAERDRMTWLPFGEGPRNCIGNRFGILQTKVGLVSILSHYNIHVSKETPIPMIFNKKALILTPISGVPLLLTRRTKKVSDSGP